MLLQTPPRGGSPCIISSPSPPSGWAGTFTLKLLNMLSTQRSRWRGGRLRRNRIWGKRGVCPEVASVTEKGVSVTKLIQRMREELVRRNYPESTMRTYLQVVEDFRRYSQTRLDQRGPDDIRR